MTNIPASPLITVRSRLARLRDGALGQTRVARWLRPSMRPKQQRYGRGYRVEPLPEGLGGERLQQYVDRMSWFHCIDLGGGVVTKGLKPVDVIDREWDLFELGDLRGRSVLDIGGVDGGHAFHAELAGASPVAVLDHYVWSAHADRYGEIYRAEIAEGRVPPAPHDSAAWDPDSMPSRWRFDVARQVLGSNVRTMAFDFMDCDLRRVGKWDVVLYLGVLYHMEDPVRALRRVAAVTRQQTIIETEAIVVPGHPQPLWRFFPQGEQNNDRTTLWAPNLGGLLGLVGLAGFRDSEVLVGEPEIREGTTQAIQRYRAIVRAIK